jgi:hypothetical protein
MPRRTGKITFVIIGVLLVLIIAGGIGWYSTASRLQQVSRDRDFQQQEAQNFRQQSDRLSGELEQVKSQLTDTEEQVADIKRQLDGARSLYDIILSQLNSTKTQLEESREDLAQSNKELQLYKDTWGSTVASGEKPPFINVRLVEKSAAADPTWVQLQGFILADKTDANRYIPDKYVCGEFASDVHNNAEAAGIRCALVAIKLDSSWHACDAFMTTDRGLVFVDCTGVQDNDGPPNRDKTVSIALGKDYIPVSMFPQPGWEIRWQNIGKILDVQVYW